MCGRFMLDEIEFSRITCFNVGSVDFLLADSKSFGAVQAGPQRSDSSSDAPEISFGSSVGSWRCYFNIALVSFSLITDCGVSVAMSRATLKWYDF